MYAIKQAMLLSGALPIADVTIYYMDIRAFGKGYEEFFQTARAMGVEFVKGKVARIDENADRDVVVRFENVEDRGQIEERAHDVVVLSSHAIPGNEGNVNKVIDGLLRTGAEVVHSGVMDVHAPGHAQADEIIIDGPEPVVEPKSVKKVKPPKDLPAYLRSLYEVPLLTVDERAEPGMRVK